MKDRFTPEELARLLENFRNAGKVAEGSEKDFWHWGDQTNLGLAPAMEIRCLKDGSVEIRYSR